tara:strand:+ start:804 stop:3683 length:2880 start_codon:yes stop_codon:yes gene_type:complete
MNKSIKMNKPTKITKHLSSYLILFFISIGYTQESNSNSMSLPETVFGEWHNSKGSNEYNGLLIHPGFIESGYIAFTYQDIQKNSDDVFVFSAQDNNENIRHFKLKVIANDTIQLQLGESAFSTFVKHNVPVNSKRITAAEIPAVFQKNWFTTDGNNTLEFKVDEENITFRNKKYSIEDIVVLGSEETGQYRFVVKNENEYWMFYFKNWNEHFLQVGFNGKMGDLYKSNKDLPNTRILDVENYLTSTFPKELRGNWLKTDGSNLWAFGLYYNYAILDRKVWNYKAVQKKRKFYVITLENNGVEKTIYAKPNKDATISFGSHKNNLLAYSLTPTNNPNLKISNDNPFTESDVLKRDSTTYSGIIKNFDKESKQKTGQVFVSNVITGKQEPYLIKIADDGRFLLKFPLYYPQEVFVRLPNNAISVFVEPGKETWQLINSNAEGDSFFAGDCAQINTDLNSLNLRMKYSNEMRALARSVDNISLQSYKEQFNSIYDKKEKLLDSVIKSRFISNKAQQLLRLELAYGRYMNILSYDIHSQNRQSNSIDADYIDFLTPAIYNNKLAVMVPSYSSFINRIKFLEPVRGSNNISVTHPEIDELAEILKNKGVLMSDSEFATVNTLVKFKNDNGEALKKRKDFNEKNKDVLSSFGQKISKLYQKLPEEKRNKLINTKGIIIDNILEYAAPLNINFSDEELAAQKASENLLTKEEQTRLTAHYNEDYNKRKQEILRTYSVQVKEFVQLEFKRKGIERYLHFFDEKGAWVLDLIISQTILRPIVEQLTPLSNEALNQLVSYVNTPYIKDHIVIENEKTIAEIEKNKDNTEYIVHETPDAEAEKIFEAIIEKYKGKVVFVDFWATWCGPCLSGMQKMKPLKEELKDEDIVFVYITNQTSPEKTYTNMIPNINGEHYRVSADEWNYLGKKFNITGIPHYTLVDKAGKVAKNPVYFGSTADSFKALFEEYLNK